MGDHSSIPSPLKCTISGSFRKHFGEVARAYDECVKNDIVILSPKSVVIAGTVDDFVFLEGDIHEPQKVEQGHLDAIAGSDFLFVVNPAGYIGHSTAMEIGYAHSRSIPVWCTHKPIEPVFSWFVEVVEDIRLACRALQSKPPAIRNGASLSVLQEYWARMVVIRGFQDESLRDKVLLLVEEVGELAKATRKISGLMTNGSGRPGKSVEYELADCLFYLLDIANLAKIDFEAALRDKEEINSRKHWRIETPSTKKSSST